VIGDTVNTASRLQSLTHELGIPLVVGDALVAAIAREKPCRAEMVARRPSRPRRKTLRGAQRTNANLESAVSSLKGNSESLE
jgi:class 3 adenylate cyclase